MPPGAQAESLSSAIAEDQKGKEMKEGGRSRPEDGSAFARRRRPEDYSVQRLKTSALLVPPKPKELESA